MKPRIRLAVRERDEHRCARCGVHCPSGVGSIHHRRPRGMGGSTLGLTDHPANLVLLCGTGTTGCHGWIERYRRSAYALGWLLKQWRDPLTSPVFRQGGWWQPGETWEPAAEPAGDEAYPAELVGEAR